MQIIIAKFVLFVDKDRENRFPQKQYNKPSQIVYSWKGRDTMNRLRDVDS